MLVDTVLEKMFKFLTTREKMIVARFTIINDFFDEYIASSLNSSSSFVDSLGDRVRDYEEGNHEIGPFNDALNIMKEMKSSFQKKKADIMLELEERVKIPFMAEYNKNIDSTSNIVDVASKLRKARTVTLNSFNNHQKKYEKLTKFYQQSIKDNNAGKFSDKDCYEFLLQFITSIKDITSKAGIYGLYIAELFKGLRDKDRLADSAFSKAFANFSVFVSSKISSLDFEKINQISKVLQGISLNSDPSKDQFCIENILSLPEIDFLGTTPEILNIQIEVVG